MILLRKIIKVGLVILFLHAIDRPAVFAYSYGSNGLHYFHEAYKSEEKDPQRALVLYEKSLSLGLKKELREAALWRLFYLYNSFHYYYDSMRVFNLLGGKKYLEKIEENLKKEMGEFFAIPEKDTESYMEAMGLLHQNPFAKSGKYLPIFQTLLERHQGNWNLYRDMVNGLHKYNKASLCLGILAKISGESAERDLMEADLLIFLGKYIAAYNLLETWGSVVDADLRKYFYDRDFFSKSEVPARQRTMEPGAKAMYFYLLGTIFRKWKRPFDAALQFLLASRHARGEDSARYRSLAAFMLYKRGELELAYQVILKIPDNESGSVDANIRLLILLLKYEKSGAESLKGTIRKLIQEENASYTGFLLKRARQVVR